MDTPILLGPLPLVLLNPGNIRSEAIKWAISEGSLLFLWLYICTVEGVASELQKLYCLRTQMELEIHQNSANGKGLFWAIALLCKSLLINYMGLCNCICNYMHWQHIGCWLLVGKQFCWTEICMFLGNFFSFSLLVEQLNASQSGVFYEWWTLLRGWTMCACVHVLLLWSGFFSVKSGTWWNETDLVSSDPTCVLVGSSSLLFCSFSSF